MQKRLFRFLLVLSLIFLFQGAASAGTVAWSQQPDWPLGFDILSNADNPTGGLMVADDFYFPRNTVVTDVHWWGSYIDDTSMNRPQGFWLGLWSDVPATEQTPSHPNQLLQEYLVFPTERLDGYQQWTGHNGYKYDVDIPGFTANANQVYWLAIVAIPKPPTNDPLDPTAPKVYHETTWGWKTSDTHWNDDAVQGFYTIKPVIGDTWTSDWTELRYPVNHPHEGQSADMAFELTVPEPSTVFLLGSGILGLLFFRKKKI